MRSPISVRNVLCVLLVWPAAAVPSPPAAEVEAGASPRERVLLDSGWVFKRGDPEGAAAELRYDVRPPLVQDDGGKAADAAPEAVQVVDSARERILKPWILPAGNAFIGDPEKRHVRPSGNPGSDLSYVQDDLDDTGWETVTLPHDWAIEGPFLETGPYGGMGRLPSWGIGWYRKDLDIPAGDAGRKILLDVEGAMSYAAVWLNGHLVGGWPYGYNSWRLDLTPFIAPGGANQLAIRLDNPPESSRWYPGGGLYRDVWLTKTNPIHVSQWGTYVTTPEVSEAAATVDIAVSIDNETGKEALVRASTWIYALADGARRGEPVATLEPQSARIPAGAAAIVEASTTVSRPRLWGPPPDQTIMR